jgi:hypothetical protein
MVVFKASVFKSTVFKTDKIAPSIEPTGGAFQYYDKYVERERAAKKAALEELNKEIAVIEREEKPLIKKAKRNTEAEIKLLALQDEINALRLEREALIRMIDDEEAIFILLAAQPFN